MNINDIIATLELYLQRFPDEYDSISPLRHLITSGAEVMSRKEFRGHVTTSALVLAPSRAEILMVHHRLLNTWLLPGGHLEPDDLNIRYAALRELTEETGLQLDYIQKLDSWKVDCPVHLDRHWIPANSNRHEPRHEHWDFRYLFFSQKLELQSQVIEIHAAAWRSIQTMQPALVKRLQELELIG